MTSRMFLSAAMLAASPWIVRAGDPPPIACNLKALTTDQRTLLRNRSEHVIAAITSSRSLRDGYAFRIDPAKASVTEVAELLDLWRRCCPFYEFRIDLHAADAVVWLSVTGRPGVKEYIPIDAPRLASKLPK